MADEAQAGAKPPAPAASGVSIKIVILATVGALVIGLGGAVAFFKLTGGEKEGGGSTAQTEEAAAGKDVGAKKSGKAKKAPATMVALDPFIVNLADEAQVRYLKIAVNLAIDQPEAEETLDPWMAPIRDSILVLLSSKESQDLRTPQGKFRLREQITQRVNAVVPKPIVTNTYFTEFVVQ